MEKWWMSDNRENKVSDIRVSDNRASDNDVNDNVIKRKVEWNRQFGGRLSVDIKHKISVLNFYFVNEITLLRY